MSWLKINKGLGAERQLMKRNGKQWRAKVGGCEEERVKVPP